MVPGFTEGIYTFFENNFVKNKPVNWRIDGVLTQASLRDAIRRRNLLNHLNPTCLQKYK